MPIMRVTLTSIYIFNTIGYVSADFTTNAIYPDNIEIVTTPVLTILPVPIAIMTTIKDYYNYNNTNNYDNDKDNNN